MRATLFGATLLLLAVPVSGSALERAFYLTKKSVPATEATSACAPRYHMASIFELLQPGALHYDASVGMTVGDSGAGAPAGEQGWVRSGTAGREWSCDWWTNNTASGQYNAVLGSRNTADAPFATVTGGLLTPPTVTITAEAPLTPGGTRALT